MNSSLTFRTLVKSERNLPHKKSYSLLSAFLHIIITRKSKNNAVKIYIISRNTGVIDRWFRFMFKKFRLQFGRRWYHAATRDNSGLFGNSQNGFPFWVSNNG